MVSLVLTDSSQLTSDSQHLAENHPQYTRLGLNPDLSVFGSQEDQHEISALDHAAVGEAAWKINKEYKYSVTGRTLTALHQCVEPISKPQYASIHTKLPGWSAPIPDRETHWNQLPLSEKPWEIKLKDGLIDGMTVSKTVPIWEVNILKGIASQLQVNTQGKHLTSRTWNQKPSQSSGAPNEVYRVMEDTVTGECEVLYDVSPLPAYVLQSQPELAPLWHLGDKEQVIDVVKSQNFSKCDKRLDFQFGIDGISDFKHVGENKAGNFLSRSALSRIVLTGSLNEYVIQSSVTTNKVILSPMFYNEQKGMIFSRLNLTLVSWSSASGSPPSVSDPRKEDDLIYSYESSENNVYQKELEEDSLLEMSLESGRSASEESSGSIRPISSKINPVEAVRKIASEIGSELQYPDAIPKENTLAKFTILTRLVQVMSAKQLKEAGRSLYTPSNKPSSSRTSNTWKAFRDAVGEAGTGPALVTLKEWIMSKKVRGEDAAELVSSLPRAALTPTPEYLNEFFDTVTGECEVLYDVSPLPAYVLQSQPELAPLWHLGDKEQVIDVVKSQNFSKCDKRLDFQFGIDGISDFKHVGENKAGNFLSRSALSRIVLTGSLNEYVIQSSVTTNKVILSPMFYNEQKGMIFSRLNLTLVSWSSASGSPPSVSDPRKEDDLIYSYESSENNVYQKELEEDSLLEMSLESGRSASEESSGSIRPISSKINPVEAVRKIASEIGSELQYPDAIPKENTLAKFTILTRLVQVMSAKQLKEAGRSLYTPSNKPSSSRTSNTWKAFRDAVGEAGTGPALVTLKEWIMSKKVRGEDAAELVSSLPRAALTPTPEYLNEFFPHELRCAAVFQIMKAQPPANMLQRMAELTNEDPHAQVNAAVKSAIESAANLQGPWTLPLALNAKAAVHLLNPEKYGSQYTRSSLRSYASDKLNLGFEQQVDHIGSDDHIVPRALLFNVRRNLGGVNDRYMSFDAMTSSVDDLLDVLLDQIGENEYSDQRRHFYNEENQYSENPDSKWNLNKIGAELNIKTLMAEQLEGNILFQLAASERFFAFDNHTIEALPSIVKAAASALHSGNSFNFTKFYNQEAVTVGFPNVMGLPFLFTFNTPTLLQIGGEARIRTHPDLAQGSANSIPVPSVVNASAEVHFVYSTKIEGQIGFVTPFDHRQYVAAVDKNTQLNLPISASVDVDMENSKIQATFSPINSDRDYQIFHCSSKPYTTKHDIINLKPYNQDSDYHKIHVLKEPRQQQAIFGENSTGMAFRLNYKSEKEFNSTSWIVEEAKKKDPLVLLYFPWADDTIQYTNVSLTYDARRSSTKAVKFTVAFANETSSSRHSEESKRDRINPAEPSSHSPDSETRRQEFLDRVAEDIKSSSAMVVDVSAEFQGHEKAYFIATAAVASSPVDEKARALFFFSHQPASSSVKPLQGTVEQSYQRRRFVKHSPMAKLCESQMNEGNYGLPACRNVSIEANYRDRLEFSVHYENLPTDLKNLTYKAYQIVRYLGYNYLGENIFVSHNLGEKVVFEGNLNPSLRAINVTIKSPIGDAEFIDVPLNPYVVPLLPVHPTMGSLERLSPVLFSDQLYPYCVVGRSAANTFDNKTYPIQLGKCWHVMMKYAPKYIPGESSENIAPAYCVVGRSAANTFDNKTYPIQLGKCWHIMMKYAPKYMPGESSENFDPSVDVVVMTRDNSSSSQKDLKIVTGDDVVDLTPSGGSTKIGLEVKANHTYRGEVRGLCGTFTGEPVSDFKTPNNCIMKQPELFVASYALTHESCQGPALEYKKKAQEANCTTDDIKPLGGQYSGHSQVSISSESSESSENSAEDQSKSCSVLANKVFDEGNMICISVRPQPACASDCSPSKMQEKNVPVHCLSPGSAANHMIKQIKKGARLNLARKGITKSLRSSLPKKREIVWLTTPAPVDLVLATLHSAQLHKHILALSSLTAPKKKDG
uniref:Vitellogenin n=1 Tax=Timema shepardi TaxID=629360 RepID=A0A7R9AN90_TIMSH|nr:unnamed protein product [Timema shepardi]